MTVGKKLHQTLNSLRSAKADMEAFAMDTDDKDAKKLYQDNSKQLGNMIDSVAGRTNYVESEEPQYKVKEKNMNK